MTTETQTNAETTLARPIAAEDLFPGDYVALLSVVYEFPSFLWGCDSQVHPPHEPVRIELRAFHDLRPMRICEVCLPFVFVRKPTGRHKTLDVRRCQLVRLDRGYAKRVWKTIRRSKKKREQKGRQSNRLKR